MTRRVLRTHEAADYIGQSVDWTRTALADGTILGGRKARGRWMISQADLDAWIDAGRPERDASQLERQRDFPRVMSRTAGA